MREIHAQKYDGEFLKGGFHRKNGDGTPYALWDYTGTVEE
jgi:hypothetical protein